MIEFMKKHSAEMKKRFDQQPPKWMEEAMERLMKKMNALYENDN